MLRGFLLLSLLFAIAIVAVFGFRGQKSTGSPIEVFPDMVRQMKVRAQAPSIFCGWTRPAPAGRRNGADRLRNAEAGNNRNARDGGGGAATASASRLQRRH